jgi:hypothetical protein
MRDCVLFEHRLQEDMKYRGFPRVQTGRSSRRPKCRKKKPVEHF